MRIRNRRTWVALVLLFLASVLATIDLVQHARQPVAVKIADDPRLMRVLPEVNFAGQGLNDVLDFLRDVADVPIRIDWQQLAEKRIAGDAPVYVRLNGIRVWRVIDIIVSDIDAGRGVLFWRLEGGSVIISTSRGVTPNIMPWDDASDDAVVAVIGRQMPQVNFSGQGLADVLDFVREVAGVNIHVDWGRMESINVNKDASVQAILDNPSLLQLINVVLKSAGGEVGLACWVDDGFLHISTASSVPAIATPRGWTTHQHQDIALKTTAALVALLGLVLLFWKRLWILCSLACIAMFALEVRSANVIDDLVWSMWGSRFQVNSDSRNVQIVCVNRWEHAGPIMHRAMTISRSRSKSLDEGSVEISVQRDLKPPIPPTWKHLGLSGARGQMLGRPGWFVSIPHRWLAAAFALAPVCTGVVQVYRMIRARRRGARGCCVNCGYDLRATPGRCPECGHRDAARERAG